MKHFILRFIKTVVTPLVLLFISYECVTRSLPNSYKMKHEYLINKGDSIDVLILGSSHGLYGFNPEFFSHKVFNAANVSQPIDYDWNILHSYKYYMPNLKAVVLPLLTSSFWGDLHLSSESYRCRKYAIYMPSLKLDESIINKFELFRPSITPLLSYLRGKDIVQISSLGFGLSYSVENRVKNLEKASLEAVERHSVDDYNLGFENKMKSFIELCEFCDKRKIDLYILRMPAFDTYKENIDENLKFKFDSIISEVQESYNYNYFDFWKDTTFHCLDFYDGDHLNNRGAEKISKIVDSILYVKRVVKK